MVMRVKVASVSVEYLEAHQLAAHNVNEETWKSVNSMKNLISKCQELNEKLKTVETLSVQMYAYPVIEITFALVKRLRKC